MTTPKTPAAVAGEAAEAIRELNHRTMPGRAELEYPADVCAVIGDLMVMARRLPQLLGQLATWLEAEHWAGRVGHDTRQDPGGHVAIVRDALRMAGDVASVLSQELRDAHNACSGLTGLDNNEEG